MNVMPQLPVSDELLAALERLKGDDDSFEDVIWDLLEREPSEETLRAIEQARAQARRGETVTLDEYERTRDL
jgi:predicted CopG family antitoxin